MHHLSDAELVDAARHGQSAAFDLLFERYYDQACEYSSRFASPDVAPDRVTVAFARIYRALLSGRSQEGDFTTVVQSAVRGVHADVVRRGRKEFLVEDDDFDSGQAVADDNPVRAAFASLDPSWRKVLWFSVVLEESEDEVADRLSMTAKQVASLWPRAREGLRRACLAEGIPTPDDLGALLTPSLVLDVPGTTAGRSPSRGVLAVLLGRLPHARPAVLGAAGVATAATVAVLVVVALASGSDEQSPAADAPAPSSPADSSGPGLLSRGQTLERVDRTKKPTKSPTTETASPSEIVTPTTPIVPPPSSPSPTTTPLPPSPTISEQSASASGSGLLRVARVDYDVTPLSADQVVVSASNVRFMSVNGAGVVCSGQSVSEGDGVVTCRVVGSQSSSFSMTINVTYADTSQPVSGSVTLTGAAQVVSDRFAVAAD